MGVTQDHLLLRDLLRKIMAQHDLTTTDISELSGVELATVNNFLSERTTKPYGDNYDKLESFVQKYGMTRGSVGVMIHTAGTPKRKKEFKEKPELRSVLTAVAAEIERRGINRMQFIREARIAKGSTSSFFNSRCMKWTENFDLAKKWLESRPAEVKEEDIDKHHLEEMGIKGTVIPDTQTKIEGSFSLTNKTEGKNYVCAFLDDWQKANTIASIMNNPSMKEEEKRGLLGKLFAQDFPTLSPSK